MKSKITYLLTPVLIGIGGLTIQAQTASSSDNLVLEPRVDRTIKYAVDDVGVSKPINFGLDLAWLDQYNIVRGVRFMDKSNVGIVRSSFMPTSPLVNDQELQGTALDNTNLRINILKDNFPDGIDLALNSDHPSVDPYYKGNAQNWAKLIEVTAKMHEAEGFNVITVSPFNEPDYSETGQGTKADFNNINGEIKSNSYFDGKRISGGNTLNPDVALDWYNYLKDRLDEGNTHQLAGTFDNYANFFQTVRADGNHATNDELHNVMEAMVGSEYGMQTGIWWYTAEYARGEFVKAATNGVRLGYAEHRPNWTAASVYRQANGKVQAFGGVSERQARPTNYNFISTDRVVYYDGHGPYRNFVLEMPADPNGTYGSANQKNAERVINITWGDDVQPAINGEYKLVNKSTGLVMEVSGSGDGANVQSGSDSSGDNQKWNVTPLPNNFGGDFSYFKIQPLSDTSKALDVFNFSLEEGGNIIQWSGGFGTNQLWYLEYKSDGYFYIRSKHSSYCLQVDGTGNVVQGAKTGNDIQQWRLIPVDADVEFNAPSVPSNLVATALPTSIKLSWAAVASSDLAGYNVYRSTSAGGPYNTIARTVTSTSFVDNSALAGVTYYYTLKAIDKSLNRSGYSNQVSAKATGAKTIVAHYTFDGNINDVTENLNHTAPISNVSYITGVETQAINLGGTKFIKLPADIASHKAITVATWVKLIGTTAWQRIWDFGNDQSENMYLTSKNGSGNVQFTITNGGLTQNLNGPVLETGRWIHVAVTLDATGISLYVNGTEVDKLNQTPISPIDFKPVLNYIGRSQYSSDPLLNASVDDFKIYNYKLAPSELAVLAANEAPVAVNDEMYVSEGATSTTLFDGTINSLLNNDNDRENDPITAFVVTEPTNGSLTLNADGTFSYTHNGSATTSDSFTYYINDGMADSNVATVNITILPFALSNDNFTIETKSETCAGLNNSEISITAKDSYDYTATVNGTDYNFTGQNLTLTDLAPGTYDVCIYVSGKTFEQCFKITLEPGLSINGISNFIGENTVSIQITQGTAPYEIFINGQSRFETADASFSVEVNQGDLLEVTTAKNCEGVYSQLIDGLMESSVTGYPNPTRDIFNIMAPTTKTELKVEVYTITGQVVLKGNYAVKNRRIQLNLEELPAGAYISRVYLDTAVSLTIIKK
ncbi:LamG-like jellyroll fold domain-containing protein [Aegicerativicinus sediminis]|uniref:LamG-like jellyroll fold domain-containing protein n=1 Tax=Aegicerativicinus sediminis TaxID=2893202 RepID=UPI001E58ADC7|nr:LamG-like jellyroll fold domain-containing protein [Aegicerativicinus sediminis]